MMGVGLVCSDARDDVPELDFALSFPYIQYVAHDPSLFRSFWHKGHPGSRHCYNVSDLTSLAALM